MKVETHSTSEHPFNKETFNAVLTTAISMRANIHQTVGENICSAQEKQLLDYNWRYQVPNKIKVRQSTSEESKKDEQKRR